MPIIHQAYMRLHALTLAILFTTILFTPFKTNFFPLKFSPKPLRARRHDDYLLDGLKISNGVFRCCGYRRGCLRL